MIIIASSSREIRGIRVLLLYFRVDERLYLICARKRRRQASRWSKDEKKGKKQRCIVRASERTRETERKDKKKTNDFNWRRDDVKQRTVVSEGAPISPAGGKERGNFRGEEGTTAFRAVHRLTLIIIISSGDLDSSLSSPIGHRAEDLHTNQTEAVYHTGETRESLHSK